MCFSLSYYKILNVLSTEEVHVWKSDCMVNTNFLLPPFHGKGEGGDRGKKKITVQMDPSPSLLGSSVNDFECFGWKTKMENWLQFSIFLRHATDCNMVGKAKLLLSFIFLFIVERIKVKICYVSILYQKEKKVKNFWLGTLTFWHQFSIFDFKRKLNEQMTHGPLDLLDLCRVNLSAIFLYNTILHCVNSSLTKKIMVKAIDCIWNQGFIAVCSWLLYGVTPFKPVASLVRTLLVEV